jgi:hypothetical protein
VSVPTISVGLLDSVEHSTILNIPFYSQIDLNAANEKKILVAEVTGSNVVSVAEHVVMTVSRLMLHVKHLKTPTHHYLYQS